MSNTDIAKILREISEMLAARDVAFKPQAYEKASRTIEMLDTEVKEIYEEGGLKALENIPSVGVSIAKKIEKLVTTGKLTYYNRLKKAFPIDIDTIVQIEGMGPKSALKLYQELGIRTLDDLAQAAEKGKIRGIPGFGEKSEVNIRKGIAFFKKSRGRFILGFIMPRIRAIEERFSNLKGVSKIVVAGSIRRRKETIGDVDILVLAKQPKSVMDYLVSMPEVIHVYAHGETKSSVRLKQGIDMDVRIVPEESYGAALNYFTGSKTHNVALRELAIKQGYKLNEYGLFKGKKQIAGKTEKELYKKLGLDYIEPEMRENRGEIELARKHKLPSLIPYDALQGDLQVQTSWSDGKNSIEEMVRAALDAGLSYIAITDHTKRLAMTGGLDEKKIKKQWKEIDDVNAKLKKEGVKFTVLKGSECDILKDGSLDLDDDILTKLDVVGGAVHSHFNLSKKDQTKRIKRAMESPHIDIIFHPTGRVIQRREAYEVDINDLITTAKRTNTVLEINAYPDRLDLKDEHIKMCVDHGIKISINSDAHSAEHLAYLEYGIAQARRGWATKRDVINAWPLEKMKRMLK